LNLLLSKKAKLPNQRLWNKSNPLWN
jgi:hypothetical protein